MRFPEARVDQARTWLQFMHTHGQRSNSSRLGIGALARISLVAVTAFVLGGCATVTRGTKDTLVVQSEPAGADVRLSSGQTGKTPATFKLSRKESLVVTITKAGYEPAKVEVVPEVAKAGAAGMAGNALIGGLIGAGVDAASGAMNDLQPNPVMVKLVKLKPHDAGAALAARLEELKTAHESGRMSAEEYERQRASAVANFAAAQAAGAPPPAAAVVSGEP